MRAARGGNAGNISEGPLTLDCFLMADNLLHLLRSPLGTKCGCRDVRDQGEYWRVSGPRLVDGDESRVCDPGE
jgi:hypothetical protein